MFVATLSTLNIVCPLVYSGRVYDLQIFYPSHSCEHYASERLKPAGEEHCAVGKYRKTVI
jgi:hypothetical protein